MMAMSCEARCYHETGGTLHLMPSATFSPSASKVGCLEMLRDLEVDAGLLPCLPLSWGSQRRTEGQTQRDVSIWPLYEAIEERRFLRQLLRASCEDAFCISLSKSPVLFDVFQATSAYRG
jgi:hypothetical protein